MENEWQQYGLDETQWDSLSENEKEAYRKIGEIPIPGDEEENDG